MVKHVINDLAGGGQGHRDIVGGEILNWVLKFCKVAVMGVELHNHGCEIC